MRSLWYRLLAWTIRQRYAAFVRVELVAAVDGPIRRVLPLRDYYLLCTDHSVYQVHHSYYTGSPLIGRLA